MPTPVIRMAGAADAAALAALRRTWTEENAGDVADEGFEARFIEWYERESARRLAVLLTVAAASVVVVTAAAVASPRPAVPRATTTARNTQRSTTETTTATGIAPSRQAVPAPTTASAVPSSPLTLTALDRES